MIPRLLLLLVLSAGPAAAGDPRELLRTAVEKWAEEIDRWSFVQHVREYRGDTVRETRRERFDPSQPDASRWALLEINGRPPTAEELEAFDQRKNARPRMRFEAPARYVDFKRVRVVEASDEMITFDVPLRGDVSLFVPFEDILARVVVEKDTAIIRRVELGLREEMRIAFGLARVMKLDLDLRLHDAAFLTDPGAPASPARPPDGHASATISKFGRRADITWTDFVRVVPEGKTAQAAE